MLLFDSLPKINQKIPASDLIAHLNFLVLLSGAGARGGRKETLEPAELDPDMASIGGGGTTGSTSSDKSDSYDVMQSKAKLAN